MTFQGQNTKNIFNQYMRGIGSNFELNLLPPFKPMNNFEGYQFLNTGRSCLSYVSHKLPDGIVLLPSYICDSMISPFSNRTISYYPIDRHLNVVYDEL